MSSMNHEEVRSRRAKGEPRQLHSQEKVVIVSGILILFLAIGLSLQWPALLSAGVPGAILLVILIFRYLKIREQGRRKAEAQGTFSEEEGATQPVPASSRAYRKMLAESLRVKSEQTISKTYQEEIPSNLKEEVTSPETLPAKEEDLSAPEVFSEDEVLAQIQERLATVEEKVTKLGNLLISLEARLAQMQETQAKSAPQIDLQAILSNLERQDGKTKQ